MTQAVVPFLLASAVGAILYCLYRPHWAFLLVIIMFPLEQLLQAYIPFFARHSSLLNLAVIGIAAFAITMRSFRREGMASGYSNPVTYLTLGLYLLWTAGIFYSPAPDMASKDWAAWFAYQFLLLVLMPLCVRDMTEYRRMLVGLMFVGTIISILIILNPRSTYYAGRLHLDLGMVGEGHVDRGNPLALASMGAMIALIAALYRPVRATVLMTLLRAAAFVFGLGLAIGSGSRGQVLAASICGILFYPMSRKLANPKQFLLIAFGFMVLVGGLYFVFNMFIGAQNQERWDALQMLKDTTTRLDMVMILLNAYLDNPSQWMFGLGTYAFVLYSPDRNADYVHNVMAEVLCEHGIVGAMMFAGIMYLVVKHSRRLWQLFRDDPSMRAASTLLIATALYALLEALKQGNMAIPTVFSWWVVLAKLSYHEQRAYAESAALEQWAYDQDLAMSGESYGETYGYGSDAAPGADNQEPGGYALGY